MLFRSNDTATTEIYTTYDTLSLHDALLISGLRLDGPLLSARAVLSLIGIVRRFARVERLLKGDGLGRVAHAFWLAVELLSGAKSRDALARHTHLQAMLQIIVLPFEDKSTLETERMERCPAAFAYVDPDDQKVKFVPACAWGLHKTEVMRRIAAQWDYRCHGRHILVDQKGTGHAGDEGDEDGKESDGGVRGRVAGA